MTYGKLIAAAAQFLATSVLLSSVPGAQAETGGASPFLVVLGVAQDGGVPQAGTRESPSWRPADFRRQVVSLALVDPQSDQRFLFEATPDFRQQLADLDTIAPVTKRPGLDGIFLTHAHIGHYSGLMFLGHESMGSQGVPVYAMPRMASFLRHNGPWSQLVKYRNIDLRELTSGRAVELSPSLSVTPLLVPHRQEFSEVVGYRIDGPQRSALFIPDIDSWEEWDAAGTKIEDLIKQVDVAYLDATFFADGEIPGRNMSGFPHPFIRHSMERFADLAVDQRKKVRFIHLNHTNPALVAGSAARLEIEERGFLVAQEGERFNLGKLQADVYAKKRQAAALSPDSFPESNGRIDIPSGLSSPTRTRIGPGRALPARHR